MGITTKIKQRGASFEGSKKTAVDGSEYEAEKH
jgi:hypothetical protein